jgi:hypothetical protein
LWKVDDEVVSFELPMPAEFNREWGAGRLC